MPKTTVEEVEAGRAPAPSKFPAEELADNCGQLFSVKAEVLESALAPMIARGQINFTVEEAQAAIQRFMRKEVRRNV